MARVAAVLRVRRWVLGREPRSGGKRGEMADTSGPPTGTAADCHADAGVLPVDQPSRWIRPRSEEWPGLARPVRAMAGTTETLSKGPASPVAVTPLVLPPIAAWSITQVQAPASRSASPRGPGANGSKPVKRGSVPEGSVTRSGASRSRGPSSGEARPASNASAAPRSGQVRSRASARVVPQSCEWCRQPLGPRNHSGRRRVYCSQSCRQRAYQSRKRSKQLGLKDGELLVSSVLLARMNRRLQALEAALREVEMTDLQAVDERIAKLCQAARRLRRMVVGPPTR